MSRIPHLEPVPLDGNSRRSRQRRALEPIIAEHVDGFADAMEHRTPKNGKTMADRIRCHHYLDIAGAAYNQASELARSLQMQANPFSAFRYEKASEAHAQDATLDAPGHITEFITQMVHWSLDVYPRLLAPNFVSMQPFTQPSGFVFFFKRVMRDPSTGDKIRDAADLDEFDKNFAEAAEGKQVPMIGSELTKQLVEAKSKKLGHTHSWEVDVAMRSQYGLALEMLGDVATADELAWEVDREVIDALVTFAGTNPRGDVFFDPTMGGGFDNLTPSEQKAYLETFLSKTLMGASVDMSADVYRQPDWYLAGSNVIKLLAQTPTYTSMGLDSNMADRQMSEGAITHVGTMRTTGQRLFHDPQLDPDTMVIGHTNNMNPFYAGYIMSPFGMASILTNAWLNPNTFMYVKSRALMFAQVGVRAAQYRVIKLGTPS